MMRDTGHIRDYARAVAAATRMADLQAAAEAYYATTPVTMSSYHHYPAVGSIDFERSLRVFSVGFPEGFARTYRAERLWECDPFVRYVTTTTTPMFWSDGGLIPNLTAREKDYLAHASQAGLGEGLAVPVFGPRGRNGYCGLGFGPGADRPDADWVWELQAACQTGHLGYCDVLSRSMPVEASLSAREKEILRWVARGQTNGEIASTLQISRNTVETYIRRSFEKLDVTDRVSAALRGMALGIVD